jgi:hypothetical protein
MNEIKRITTRLDNGSNRTEYLCDRFKTISYHIMGYSQKDTPVSFIHSFGRWTPVNMDRKTVADVLRHMRKVQKTS